MFSGEESQIYESFKRKSVSETKQYEGCQKTNRGTIKHAFNLGYTIELSISICVLTIALLCFATQIR